MFITMNEEKKKNWNHSVPVQMSACAETRRVVLSTCSPALANQISSLTRATMPLQLYDICTLTIKQYNVMCLNFLKNFKISREKIITIEIK